jgi:hypothetical protein
MMHGRCWEVSSFIYLFFKVCKSVHHRRIQTNHQPDATILQFIILTLIYSSTRFGRSPAHHQELKRLPLQNCCIWLVICLKSKQLFSCSRNSLPFMVTNIHYQERSVVPTVMSRNNRHDSMEPGWWYHHFKRTSCHTIWYHIPQLILYSLTMFHGHYPKPAEPSTHSFMPYIFAAHSSSDLLVTHHTVISLLQTHN